MPPENRVGRDYRGNVAQQPPAQTLPAPRQPAPVLISQPQSSPPQLRTKDQVFFDQIRHGLRLPVPPPARNGHQHEPDPAPFMTAGVYTIDITRQPNPNRRPRSGTLRGQTRLDVREDVSSTAFAQVTPLARTKGPRQSRALPRYLSASNDVRAYR
jgi:hypothetical protein